MGLPSCEKQIKPPHPKYTIWVSVKTSNFGVNLGFPHHLVSRQRTWVDMGMAQINYLPPKLDGSLEGSMRNCWVTDKCQWTASAKPFVRNSRDPYRSEMAPKWLSTAQMDFNTQRLDFGDWPIAMRPSTCLRLRLNIHTRFALTWESKRRWTETLTDEKYSTVVRRNRNLERIHWYFCMIS